MCNCCNDDISVMHTFCKPVCKASRNTFIGTHYVKFNKYRCNIIPILYK